MLQHSVPKVLDLDLVAALHELQGHLNRVPRIATLQLQQSREPDCVATNSLYEPPVKQGLAIASVRLCIDSPHCLCATTPYLIRNVNSLSSLVLSRRGLLGSCDSLDHLVDHLCCSLHQRGDKRQQYSRLSCMSATC